MRLEKITNGLMDNSLKGSHVKGHLNGLLITLKMKGTASLSDYLPNFLDTAVLRVKYQHDRAQTLVPNIPIRNLMDMSNMEFGSTNEIGLWNNSVQNELQNGLNAGFASLTDTAGYDQLDGYNAAAGDYHRNAAHSTLVTFYVDLGSIYVDSGNELHFDIVPNAGATPNLEAHVYTVSKELSIAEFIEYDMDFDQNEMHQNIVEAFLCSPDSRKDFHDMDVMVNATSVQYDCDTIGLQARAMLFSKIENLAISRTLPLYRSMSLLPEDVQIKFFSDSSISDYYVVVKRVFTNVKAYLLGEDYRKKEEIDITVKLERDNPEMAKVLKLEGAVKTSAEIRESLI